MTANEHQVGGKHYKTKYEHWDLVLKIPLSYLDGCATKYVSRWRKKNGVNDLHKAKHYLDKILEAHQEGLLCYDLPRDTISRVNSEVASFALANELTSIEHEFVLALCSYRNSMDLMDAYYILEEIIFEAEEKLVRKIDEPNYPGTPDDGGHHAR